MFWKQIAGKNSPASFQNFASDLLSKIFLRFAFKKLSKILQRFAFKNFESKSLENICQLAFKFLKANWKLFWAEKTKMADIKAIIVIKRLIKNTLYIFLEELKYSIF